MTRLSIPEVAERLHVRLRDVRTMIADRKLVAVRIDGPVVVPGEQLVEQEGQWVPLGSLRGTLTLLADAGFSDEEACDWLYRNNEELGEIPMMALRHGRHREVRRIISGLAF